jgi:hypothetical protein
LLVCKFRTIFEFLKMRRAHLTPKRLRRGPANSPGEDNSYNQNIAVENELDDDELLNAVVRIPGSIQFDAETLGDGFDVEKYDFSEAVEEGEDTDPPVTITQEMVRGGPEFRLPFTSMRRQGMFPGTVIAKCAMDCDSICVTSSSLLKLCFRIGLPTSRFTFRTKVDPQNVDKSTRIYVKCANSREPLVGSFIPKNRANTSDSREIRLCWFKNAHLFEVFNERRK